MESILPLLATVAQYGGITILILLGFFSCAGVRGILTAFFAVLATTTMPTADFATLAEGLDLITEAERNSSTPKKYKKLAVVGFYAGNLLGAFLFLPFLLVEIERYSNGKEFGFANKVGVGVRATGQAMSVVTGFLFCLLMAVAAFRAARTVQCVWNRRSSRKALDAKEEMAMVGSC